MNEQELRALVREAIERHLGRPGVSTKVGLSRVGIEPSRGGVEPDRGPMTSSHSHPSHIILNVLPGSDVDEGMCVIEPAVRCNHCGFCQSYGH
jgi:hypothetical protein